MSNNVGNSLYCKMAVKYKRQTYNIIAASLKPDVARALFFISVLKPKEIVSWFLYLRGKLDFSIAVSQTFISLLF